MDYLVQASSDVGISKSTNQDSLCVKIIDAGSEKLVFAVLCDGMGGLSKGELASATLVNAFARWSVERLPEIYSDGITDSIIRREWETIIESQNSKIMEYGKNNGVKLGTTVSAILITDSRYYIVNVGDTRIYELSDYIVQLTKDQTLIQREIDAGELTPEQAKTDPRRSILLQCVGASPAVYPEMFFGETKCDAVYMMCSDGFRHEITNDEIYESLSPFALLSVDDMRNNAEYLIDLNKKRMENDNISVVLIRTF